MNDDDDFPEAWDGPNEDLDLEEIAERGRALIEDGRARRMGPKPSQRPADVPPRDPPQRVEHSIERRESRARVEVAGPSDADPSSWSPEDLEAALAGHDIEPATVLRRSDGVGLLYPGRTHSFSGESESCKTWAALFAAKQVIDDGGRVLWIDFEDDARGVVARLKALCVPVRRIRSQFVYVRPKEPLMTSEGKATAGNVALGQLLLDPYELAVIDGVTEAMGVEGLDLMSNTDVATWQKRLPNRIAATGAPVVSIDHVTKSTEGRGRFAIGGQHKLSGLTGAAYTFEPVRRFGRATGANPTTGQVKITIGKDRPGHVRGRASGTNHQIGTLDLTSYPDGGMTISITTPGEATTTSPDLGVVQAIAAHLSVYDGASKNSIERAVSGKTDYTRQALEWMAKNGHVDVTPSGNTHHHTLTASGQEFLQ